MRVVIVGGAGFIGTALARSLRARSVVPVVLDAGHRLARARKALDGIESRKFDFERQKSAAALLTGADALVHLACTSDPSRSMKDIAGDVESNVIPSVRLFDAASASGVRRVVFASSGGTVYGTPGKLPVSEAEPPHPLSAYGVSKLAVENYLALYPSLQGISLRIANPYGAYQLAGVPIGVIARYAMAAASGQSLEVWGDGSVVRDFIAIEDVVSAFHQALTNNSLPAGAYNIGSGVGHSINEVIGAIGRSANRELDVEYLDARGYDVPRIVLDTTSFTAHTGWQAGVPFEAGIAALYAKAAKKSGTPAEASPE